MMTQGEVLALIGWFLGGFLFNVWLLDCVLEWRAARAARAMRARAMLEHGGRPTSEGGQ